MESKRRLLPVLFYLISYIILVSSFDHRRLLARRQATLDGRPLPGGFITASETAGDPSSRALSYFNSFNNNNNRARNFKSKGASRFQTSNSDRSSDLNSAGNSNSNLAGNSNSFTNLVNNYVLGVTTPPDDLSLPATTADTRQSVNNGNGLRDKTETGGLNSAFRSNVNENLAARSFQGQRKILKTERAGIFPSSD